MMNRIKKIITKFKTLYQWISLAWTDKQWDYIFFLKILRFKLKLMEDYYKTRNPIKHQRIRVMVLLCDRVIADEYFESVFKPIEEKYGKGKIEFYDTVGGKGMKVTDPVPRIVREYGMMRVKRLQKQDLKMLTDYIYKYILTFWD